VCKKEEQRRKKKEESGPQLDAVDLETIFG